MSPQETSLFATTANGDSAQPSKPTSLRLPLAYHCQLRSGTGTMEPKVMRGRKVGGILMARFEAKRLSRLDWAVVGVGGLSFISLFLPWYGASAGLFSVSVDGWSTSYGWFGALLIIAAGAYCAAALGGQLERRAAHTGGCRTGGRHLGRPDRENSLDHPSERSCRRRRRDGVQLRPAGWHLFDNHRRPRAGGCRACSFPGLRRKAPLG